MALHPARCPGPCPPGRFLFDPPPLLGEELEDGAAVAAAEAAAAAQGLRPQALDVGSGSGRFATTPLPFCARGEGGRGGSRGYCRPTSTLHRMGRLHNRA